jgi:hypothetical protein
MGAAHLAVEGAHLLVSDPSVLVGVGAGEHLRRARPSFGEGDRAVAVGVELRHRTVPAGIGVERRAAGQQDGRGRGAEAHPQYVGHSGISL